MPKKDESSGKRRVWAYALTSVATAIALAGTIVAFVYAQYAVGAILAVLTVIGALVLAGEIVQDNFYLKSENLFSAHKFDEEKALLERVERNHLFFPFVQERYYAIALRNALARDDLSLVKSYIDKLRHVDDRYRHSDGKSIKSGTAYAYILILLDEGRYEEARAEYGEFCLENKNYAIYQTQIEILRALFSRLFGKSDAPLPPAAIDSPYPVIKRILGRHVEENMGQLHEDWGE